MPQVNLARADGNTALHAACWRGHQSVVLSLLSAGAKVDPTAAGPEGGTASAMPLHFAARQGHVDVVNALVAAGAKPDQSEEHGMTPLHGAAAHGAGRCLPVGDSFR